DSPIRNGVPDADFGAGAYGSFEGTSVDVRSVWGGRAETGNLCGELCAGAKTCRARRAIYPDLSHGLGPPRGCAAPVAAAVHGYGPGVVGADSGLETTGDARRDSGDLGRRVWADGVLPGKFVAGELWARSSSAVF